MGETDGIDNRDQEHRATPQTWWGRASARVGLLGNPSDGYGGRVLAMTVPDLCAQVELGSSGSWDTADTPLLDATVYALRERRPELVSEPGVFSFQTTIPRQVGLAGSSAIIMAALRAVAARAGCEWDLVKLAKTTLEIETDVLGWAAGPQDRVVQAYEGLVAMDFAESWQATRYHRLDLAQLPPLFMAWDRSIGAPSNEVHADVRQRWLDGDQAVHAAMKRFAELADLGRTALSTGTAATTWPALFDEAFKLRRSIWRITSIDTALVETGQSVGAGVAFAGSGGAVVGALADPADLPRARAAYEDRNAGFQVLAPAPTSKAAPPSQ